MKKIISVLFLAFTLTLFSSCIILTNDFSEHTLTFKNDLQKKSSNNIFDWYVRDEDDNLYIVKEDVNAPIASGGYSSSIELKTGTYYIYFTFEDNTDRTRPHTFWRTEKFYLNSDKVFRLTSDSFNNCTSFNQ